MKSINRIQYFLFAIILLGMFASFAQNDYSSYLLNYPFLFIGILFLIEMLLTIREFGAKQSTTIFSFFEYLALGLFFCGSFFLTIHWMGADPALLTGAVILLILYSGYGVKELTKFFKSDKGPFLILFTISLVTCLAMIACIFKLQNWAGAGILIGLAGTLSFIILLLIFINIKVQSENGKITLRNCLRKIKTKLVLSYLYFSFWAIYFALISAGIAPRLYSLANPPALEKMYQEHNPAATVYWENFQNFLNNRRILDNTKQANQISTDKNDSMESSRKKK